MERSLKRTKIKDDDVIVEAVDENDDKLLEEEFNFINDTKNSDIVKDEVADIFKFVVNRHKRTRPDDRFFDNPNAKLKDYQEEGLGWMLDREGFKKASDERIIPSAWKKSIEKNEWVNVQTGVTTSFAPVDTRARNNDDDNVDDSTGSSGFWLHKTNSVYGGIMADEMGLGKTAQMIALIATHRAPAHYLFKTLIIVPKILLENWDMELEQWTIKNRVRRLVHFGDRTERRKNKFQKYDVVITTYETFYQDIDTKLFQDRKWWRVILDEAHKIKNPTKLEGISQTVFSIKARNRWAVTGTPIQNHWLDLFSLIKFLHVWPFGQFQGWYRMIQQHLENATPYRKEAKQNLQYLVQTLVLRRTKETKSIKITTQLSEGLIIRLNIPEYKDSFWKVGDKNFNTFTVNNIDNMKRPNSEPITIPYLDKNTQQPNYKFIQELVHIPEKTIEYIKMPFDTKEEKDFYQSIEATGQIKTLDKKNLKVVKKEPKLSKTINEPKQGEEDKNKEDKNNQDADYQIKNALVYMLRLRQASVHPWLLLGADKLKEKIKRVRDRKEKWETSTKFTVIRRDVRETKNNGKRKNEKTLVFSQFKLALDLLELDLERDGWISENNYQSKLREHKKTGRGDFKYKDWPRYVRIDGQTPYEDRKKAIKDISNKPEVKLALLSLLATGVGLNLVSANNVIFLDLFFNPQVHKQAIDRTHRIGQEKNVKVKMLIINDTVEDKLITKLLKWKEGISSSTFTPMDIGIDRILSIL